MKKFTSIIYLLLITAIAHGQKPEWLFGVNKDSAKIFADDVVKSISADYRFKQDDSFTDNGANFYEVVYENANKDAYAVIFQQFNNRLFIQKLEGSFTKLFPVWQKYIDATADKEKMQKQILTAKNIDNPANTKKYLHCVFNADDVSDNDWYIQFENL